MKKLSILFFVIFFLSANILFAQTQPIEVNDDDGINKFKEANELLKIIRSGEKERDAEVARIQAGLDKNIKSIETAEEEFDKMIEAVKKAGSMGAPDSEFIKKINQIALQARQDAQEAYNDGDKKNGDKFKNKEELFLKIRDEATSLHKSTNRNIRAIEDQKKMVVRAIKLLEYDEALRLAQEGLEIIRDVNRKVAKVKETIPVSEVGPVE